MKITFLLTFILSLFCVYSQQKNVTIESEIAEIEFKSPYQFNATIAERLENNTQPWKFQSALDSYANKGEFQNASEFADIISQKNAQPALNASQIDSIKSNYTPVAAGNYISKEARSRQVVIINEAHHNPQHRIFTRSLLKELYDSGYTHLGLEALYNGAKGGTPYGNNGGVLKDEKDSLLNSRKYPIRQSCTYIEPQMGNLIRFALEIGFTIFSYEKTGVASGKPREFGQAKNIQAILEKEPNAKILIHCGYAHAYEGVDFYEPGGKSMAGWLNELTGIDPLTIDQVEYTEHGKSEFNNPILVVFSFKDSKVLINKDGMPMRFTKGNLYTDIAVVHPKTKYINDRPSWLYTFEYQEVMLDISGIKVNFPLMIFAYRDGENLSVALPVDVIEVNDRKTITHLALRQGRYTIVVANQDGQAMKFDISVE